MSPQNATESLAQGNHGWGPFQGFYLEVVEGPDLGRTWKSTADRCSIGTHRSNDLTLTDRTVSRFHCEIRSESEGARLIDLGSRNGTLVDGVRVRDGYLRQASLLRLGQTALRFRVAGAATERRISPRTEFGSVVGNSVVMRMMFDVLERVAPTDATLLLEGETGTGKGAIAESVHDLSPSRSEPFHVVDCGAMALSLLESELFGHEKGAFTDAVARRAGAFETAQGGTIFLDEIGELPLETQPKLLRVLENRKFRRVGGSTELTTRARVIAATNRDLRAAVNDRSFRSDLYYRLATVRVRVPSLREHLEDMPVLVESLLARSRNSSPEFAKKLRAKKFIETLQNAAWPGNVRELRNHLEACLVLQELMRPDEPPPPEGPAQNSPASDAKLPYDQARAIALTAWERRYLRDLLDAHDWNVVAAAKAAGMSRAYLYRRMQFLGLRRKT